MRISYVQYYNVLQCKLYIASIIIYVIYIIIFSYLSYLPRWVPRVCPHLLLNIVAGSINLSFFFKNYNHHYKQNKLELLMSSDTRIMNSKILIKLFFFFFNSTTNDVVNSRKIKYYMCKLSASVYIGISKNVKVS